MPPWMSLMSCRKCIVVTSSTMLLACLTQKEPAEAEVGTYCPGSSRVHPRWPAGQRDTIACIRVYGSRYAAPLGRRQLMLEEKPDPIWARIAFEREVIPDGLVRIARDDLLTIPTWPGRAGSVVTSWSTRTRSPS